ncbi:MAG: hypothetical protein AABX00_01300 [Nanoarchaeota archaeon]
MSLTKKITAPSSSDTSLERGVEGTSQPLSNANEFRLVFDPSFYIFRYLKRLPEETWDSYNKTSYLSRAFATDSVKLGIYVNIVNHLLYLSNG